MYLRIVKAAGGAGTTYEYVRLVESYREGNKTKQRVVFNLGRRDILAEHLDALIGLLRGEPRASPAAGQAQAIGAWDWGPVLVARQLWRELGLEKILEQMGGRGASDGIALSDRALVLVTNRLCQPTSEHGLARWLETDFVCDRYGRRWMPQWRDDEERRRSRSPRVRVHTRQLQRWYRTLDRLERHKAEIELELYLRLRDLFSLKVDLVFYDLSSTYFEGKGPPMSAHGHSRDGKPRNRQVLVGLVMVEGWPISHQVLRGNLRDATTVPQILAELEQRFGLRRVVFVGDRGMVTSDNIALLRAHGQGYLVGLNRRRREEVFDYIERATGPWAECRLGITANEQAEPPKTFVQEVASKRAGVRIFVVKSAERLAYEQAERLKAMERVRVQLEALERRVAKGQLKAPERIGAAAARILGRHHGHRYYDWQYKDGRFRFFEHRKNLAREQAYEGKYVIQTEEQGLSPVAAVAVYKELSEVERAFASLKDVIDMRPVFHHTDERVQAHIFVAALAFLLHRAIEKKLKAARLDFSATEALQALRCVRLVEFKLGDQHQRTVTRGSARAQRILAALDISTLDPPIPRKEDQTVV
jgi:transposase